MEKILSKLGLTSVPTMSDLAQILPKVATLTEAEKALLFKAIQTNSQPVKKAKAKTPFVKTVKPQVLGVDFPEHFVNDSIGINGEEESISKKGNTLYAQIVFNIYPSVKGSKVVNPRKAVVVYKEPKPYADGKYLRKVAKEDGTVVNRPDFEALANDYIMTCTNVNAITLSDILKSLSVMDTSFNKVDIMTLLQSFSPYLERPCRLYLKVYTKNNSFTFITKTPTTSQTPMYTDSVVKEESNE